MNNETDSGGASASNLIVKSFNVNGIGNFQRETII